MHAVHTVHPVLLLISLLIQSCQTPAPRTQPTDALAAHQFKKRIQTTVGLNYLLYEPRSLKKGSEKHPLLLYLHGSDVRGNNLELLKKSGLPKRIDAGDEFPFFVASPQCPEDDKWNSPLMTETLHALVNELVSQQPIDADRVYVAGHSMGGFGCWRLAGTYPEQFAAAIPICGGGNPRDAQRLAQLPIWAFHGDRDHVITINRSKAMVTALQSQQADVRFTVYSNADHEVWERTYASPALYTWLLQQHR